MLFGNREEKLYDEFLFPFKQNKLTPHQKESKSQREAGVAVPIDLMQLSQHILSIMSHITPANAQVQQPSVLLGFI